MFENNDKTKLEEDLFVMDNTIRFRTWNLADFVAFFDNYEDIRDTLGEEGIKNILSSKNVKFGNVVGDFLKLEFVNKLYETFIKILVENFDKSDFYMLLFDLHGNLRTSLLTASKTLNVDNFKHFYKVHEENLSNEKMEEILKSEWVEKPYSPYFKAEPFKYADEKSLVFLVEKIIEKFDDKMDQYLYRVFIGVSIETAKELSNVFKEKFKNEKQILRNILSYRNREGETIFISLKKSPENNEKLEIFESLLRTTFDNNQEQEYKKFIELLKKS
jgi:hypothetical protein